MARSSSKSRLRDPFRTLGDLCLWALVILPPLVVVVTAENAFRLPKLLLSEGLGLASLTAFALAAATSRDGVRGTARWRGPAVLAVVPVAAAASLGIVAGDHPVLTRQALIDLWIGAACLIGWSFAVTSEKLEKLLCGLTLPAMFVGLLGILQFHGVFRPFRFTGGEEAYRTGVTSLAGNAGDLGSYLVLPAVVAQWRLATAVIGRFSATGPRRPPLWPLFAWAAVTAVAVYGMLVTQTLTAVVAFVVATAVLWLSRLPLRRAAAWTAAAALVVGLAGAVVPPVRERVGQTVSRVAAGDWNAALTGRLDGWRAAAWMVRERPVVGVGHGAYRAEFSDAKLALQDRGVEFYGAHVDPFFANAHNDLLEAAAEWGLVGVLALGWAFWVLLRALMRWRRRGDRERWSVAAAGLAGGATLALGQFPFHLAMVGYPYLLLLAWVFRCGDETDAGEEPGARGGRLRRLVPWLAAAAGILALVAHTDRARDRLKASKQLRVVKVVSEQIAQSNRPPDRMVAGNFRLLRDAARNDPTEIGIPAALAGQYMLIGSYDAAAAGYREALAAEPRPELYLNLGRALRRSGREAEAHEAFERAVRLSPALRRELPEGVRVRRLP